MQDLPEYAIPLREAAIQLDVSVETLRRRAQRQQKNGRPGPFIKQGDEWYVIVPPEGDTRPDMSRNTSPPPYSSAVTPSDQFARVIEQAIAPYAERLEQIAIELGRERERREQVERERDALLARLAPSEDESPVKTPNAAPEGVQQAVDPLEHPPDKPKRWPWWMRILAGK